MFNTPASISAGHWYKFRRTGESVLIGPVGKDAKRFTDPKRFMALFSSIMPWEGLSRYQIDPG